MSTYLADILGPNDPPRVCPICEEPLPDVVCVDTGLRMLSPTAYGTIRVGRRRTVAHRGCVRAYFEAFPALGDARGP